MCLVLRILRTFRASRRTIRIWEKRYDILQPMRTDTNIRLYDLASLQKLLNITLLHDYGYKISK
jgi:DNA-binding transcriptional MerR regulator